MNLVQKIVTKLMPRRWAAAVEAESRTWLFDCAAGHTSSVWDAGGIRAKAAGRPRVMLRCPRCGKVGLVTLYRT